MECAVDGDGGAYGGGLALVGGEGCGGVHEGVGLLVLCLLGWWCGVVPVLKGALEEDEWGGERCGEPVVGWPRVWWCVVGPVGEVADGVCWRVVWGCVCPGCGCGEDGVELCWCGASVVAVNNGGCSCVVHGVGGGLLAVYVGDGCGGGRVWVVLFPILCGGGATE